MRILWFVNIALPDANEYFGWRGNTSGWWMVTLAEALARESDVQLAVFNCSRHCVSEQKITVGNITYYCFPKSLRNAINLSCRQELEGALAAIADFKPDIIDVHGTEYFYGLIVERVKVPVLITIQGILNEILPVYFADQNVWRVLSRQLRNTGDLKLFVATIWGYIDVWQRSRMERHIFQKNRYFSGRTEWDRLAQCRLNPQGKYLPCHRILRSSFSNCAWSWNAARKNQVFCTSAGNVYKGAHVLIEAIARLVSRFPDLQARIAGNLGYQGWGGALRRRVTQLKLEENVTFVGYLADEQILGELLNASLFVVPSFIETECIALCEAMRVGVPCVASRAGGMTSTLTDGVNGLAFETGNSGQLAEKISTLLENPGLAMRLGGEARQCAMDRHDTQQIVQTVLGNYRTVLAEEKGK